MGKINPGQVILCGLLAGVVILAGELILGMAIIGRDFEAAMADLGREFRLGPTHLLFLAAMWLVLGVLAVWLYAAMRPRFGPGVRTAVYAGLFIWAVGVLLPTVSLIWLELFPTGPAVIAIVWRLVEAPLATAVGAWKYREEPVAAVA